MMNNNSRRVFDDIPFLEMIGQSLKKWRIIIIISVVIGVFLGLYKFIPMYKQAADSNFRIQQAAENKEQIDSLTFNVTELEEQIEEQEDLLVNSIYYNVNPSAVKKGTMSFYVSIPNSGIDNDYTDDIINAYRGLIKSGEIATLVYEKNQIDTSLDYIKQIITVNTLLTSTDSISNYFEVSVVHFDEEEENKIMSLIKEVIEEKKSDIEAEVGPFSVTLMSENTNIVSDIAIKTDIENAKTSLDNLKTELTAKQSELDNLTSNGISRKESLKTGIVYSIIGFIVGFIFVTIIFAIYVIFSSKVKSENQLRINYNARVIGNYFEKRKKVSIIDKWVYRISNEPFERSFDEMIKMASTNIEATSTNKKICIVCDSNKCMANKISDELLKQESTKDRNISIVQDAGESSKSLEIISDCDSIIITSKRFSTSLFNLEKEIQIVENYKKELIGIIIV